MAHFLMEGFGTYTASRAAPEALMKTVAEEEKEHGIKVHLLDPKTSSSKETPREKTIRRK